MHALRERILEATKRILASKGLAWATTKAIAKDAGCAEGSLYNHFRDRTALLLAVFQESLPHFSEALHALPLRVGEGTVEETLKALFLTCVPFYRQVVPLMGSLFSDLALLEQYGKTLAASGQGPYTSHHHLIAYLKAEQRLGRIRPEADVTFFSEIMLGSCWQRAFRDRFLASLAKHPKQCSDYAESDVLFAAQLAEAMTRALRAP
jgi:AcrR family transcriptional regulator